MKGLRNKIFLAGLLFLCAVIVARAQETNAIGSLDDLRSKIGAYIEQPRFSGALWGIKIVSVASGKTLFESHADRLMSPASNSKLYTGSLGPGTAWRRLPLYDARVRRRKNQRFWHAARKSRCRRPWRSKLERAAAGHKFLDGVRTVCDRPHACRDPAGGRRPHCRRHIFPRGANWFELDHR